MLKESLVLGVTHPITQSPKGFLSLLSFGCCVAFSKPIKHKDSKFFLCKNSFSVLLPIL